MSMLDSKQTNKRLDLMGLIQVLAGIDLKGFNVLHQLLTNPFARKQTRLRRVNKHKAWMYKLLSFKLLADTFYKYCV